MGEGKGEGGDTICVAEHPRLHTEDVNGIRKTKSGMVGREGGTWGVPLNPFGFDSLSRKFSLSITTSTHANHLIR